MRAFCLHIKFIYRKAGMIFNPINNELKVISNRYLLAKSWRTLISQLSFASLIKAERVKAQPFLHYINLCVPQWYWYSDKKWRIRLPEKLFLGLPNYISNMLLQFKSKSYQLKKSWSTYQLITHRSVNLSDLNWALQEWKEYNSFTFEN